jgi:two-component system, NarL family, nitrate/nitrite response regulator NarL
MELLDRSESEVPDKADNPGVIRVILADSQAIYRVGISKIIALEDDIRVVAQADSLEQLRTAIERHPADVVLVEGELLTGAASSIPELLRIKPDIKLIVQSAAHDESQTVEFYRCGIRGIISRSISPDLLLRCVRRISTGETWIDNQALNWVISAYRVQEAALLNPRKDVSLSPREKAVVSGITRGMRNKEIAFEIGTTEQVIKNYLRKIYSKLGVEDRLELALYCLHNKIVKADADEVAVVQRVLAR